MFQDYSDEERPKQASVAGSDEGNNNIVISHSLLKASCGKNDTVFKVARSSSEQNKREA
jgi:hypothetical protein